MTGDVKRLGSDEVKRQLHDGGEIALLDAREEGVFHARHLLLASCVPLGRLELLVDDLVPRRGTRVVWCDDGDGSALRAARRMSELGYTDLAVLDGGIAAWEAAGYRLYSGVHVPSKAFAEVVEHEAGTPWISAPDLKALIDRGADLAIFDSRSYEEYQAGHLAGTRSAPGGQLVQETDAHIATWNARVVLVDDNGVRATMTASWLKQMGWNDVAVLVADAAEGDWARGPHVPRVLGLDGISSAPIEPAELRDRLAAGRTAVVDLDTSRHYTHGHIPGAWFAIRTRLAEDLKNLPKTEAIVLTSSDGRVAQLAAAECAAAASVPVMVLAGGTEAWARAGLPLETGASHMASEPEDVVLSARERGQGREEAMREYLAWEINLVNQMAEDDDQRFRVLAG
jgi:rhodanese-related sulfurtransferase